MRRTAERRNKDTTQHDAVTLTPWGNVACGGRVARDIEEYRRIACALPTSDALAAEGAWLDDQRQRERKAIGHPDSAKHAERRKGGKGKREAHEERQREEKKNTCT